jgi:uncharacterized membrane protein
MRSEALAALAALCWAVGSLLSASAASRMGAFAFTRWRLFFALTLLWALALWTGQWRTLDLHAVVLLVISGLIGIFIGDTALFACMNRLGPRRSGVLFATHALFSAVLAWLVLGETLWGWTLMGSALLVTGVMVAIAWGRRADEDHRWEQTQGSLATGIALGLVAAVGQSVATLMLKPLMSTGVDAVAASALRTTARLCRSFGLAMGGPAPGPCAAATDRLGAAAHLGQRRGGDGPGHDAHLGGAAHRPGQSGGDFFLALAGSLAAAFVADLSPPAGIGRLDRLGHGCAGIGPYLGPLNAGSPGSLNRPGRT